jgi:nucleotide-binding universal stress UspA family protein
MTVPARRAFDVRRIVVAADSSPHGRAAMAAAAALAGELGVDLEGLFVEDVNVLNVAELALGRELHVISGQARAFDRAALECELRAEAACARRVLEAFALRQHVAVSFRVVRGRVGAEVIAAAGEADLLVLGTASRSIGAFGHPGSTAVAAAVGATGPVLLLRSGRTIAGRALVAFDGSEGARLAVEAAVRMAHGREDALTVVVLVASTADGAAQLEAEVKKMSAATGTTLQFRHVDALDLTAMCRLTHESKADVLILAADSPVLSDRQHGRLLADAGCPVLLVR